MDQLHVWMLSIPISKITPTVTSCFHPKPIGEWSVYGDFCFVCWDLLFLKSEHPWI